MFLLESFDKNPPDPSSDVVVLSEHVDYSDDAVWRDPHGSGPAAVFVALAESWTESKVLLGENSGRRLKHVAVVRKLVLIGSTQPGSPFSKDIVLAVPSGAGANGLRVVAFAQDHATGRVVGIAKREIQR
jgi:hypothetical protein